MLQFGKKFDAILIAHNIQLSVVFHHIPQMCVMQEMPSSRLFTIQGDSRMLSLHPISFLCDGACGIKRKLINFQTSQKIKRQTRTKHANVSTNTLLFLHTKHTAVRVVCGERG